ncbi:hypothetical protein D4764_02G0003730 [Takifugu flavidus]|uniref:Alkylated DNA repair protein AlkB homologue 8 N-terminal domain-containing protein n=1 Tax=Takifugu flavidus TaxID=433684 RepID=A0A5C6NIA8_9TELE|nr:hypothetical protein D4764_02G0003730 [Takifugu flavidus]
MGPPEGELVEQEVEEHTEEACLSVDFCILFRCPPLSPLSSLGWMVLKAEEKSKNMTRTVVFSLSKEEMGLLRHRDQAGCLLKHWDPLKMKALVGQGTVLAPFLFTLYTADFSYSTSSCHLQKFSDDSAAIGLITDGDDTEHNNLPPAPVNILGTDVEVVESYKYLGVHLNNNLDWTHNTDALVKKGNSRLFLLRRLRSFGVQGPLLRTFYDSVVGSAIFYGIVCWSSSITDRDRKRMDRLDTLAALGSSFSERLLHPRCVKERYRRSFLPAAVRLHNKHNAR